MTGKLIERTPAAYGYPLIIRSLFRSAVSLGSEQEIVYADRRRLTYREFGERVHNLFRPRRPRRQAWTDRRGDGLEHQPLPRMFLCDTDDGCGMHTVNVRLSPEQILYTINHAEDDVILVNAEFLPILEQMLGPRRPRQEAGAAERCRQDPLDLTRLRGRIRGPAGEIGPGLHFPGIGRDHPGHDFLYHRHDRLPKGVRFSHRQLVLDTMATRTALAGTGHGRFNQGDVYMPVTPMFHVHAWGLPYVATTLGVKQIYPGRYLPDALLDFIHRERVTFSHCVPTILQMILASAKKQAIDLTGWKVVIGGAALPQALARQALADGVDLFTGYGMSETGPILTLSHLKSHMEAWDIERQAEVRCKKGRTVPLVQLRIVDEAMNDVPHDGEAQGEIVARAPWLT